MVTPAIENIIHTYPNAKLTIFGSFVSTKLFLHHPNLEKIIVDNSRASGCRYLNLYKLAKKAESIDIAFSFRKNFSTKFLMYFIDAKDKYIYKRYDNQLTKHQVVRYNDFINKSLNITTEPTKLKVYTNNEISFNKKPILGINPGATYGSAKRWYPDEFAKIVIELADKYDIKIFGGPTEVDIAHDIENYLKEANITNYSNLAGKTTIEELISQISELDLFITNDSGPMHLAAAFAVPTVAIFGPTRYIETSQWKNDNSMLIRKDLQCSPCMKRVCPLKHHDCMKLITYRDILKILKEKSYI